MFPKSACVLATCFVCGVAAQEPAKPQLTARELFYSAVKPPAKPAAKNQTQPKQAVATEIAAAPKNAPSPARTDLPEGGRVIPALANISAPPTAAPLGIKYTILRNSSGAMVEVPADSTFHAGDRIQLNVETNGAGYLYVISQGSSGAWKPMFPSAEVEEGNNRVEPFHQYALPPKSRMLFDEQTGTEKLFIVFSREPEPNLEKMIYSLHGIAPAAAPKPEAPPAPKSLVTVANIDDKTVGLLRTAYSRDLVIEKVDSTTPATGSADRKETAVYVINPSGSADARLVADLQLVHR
jgi:Domain of unknown function (DUF4384)